MFSSLFGLKTVVLNVIKLNILCTSSEKQYHTQITINLGNYIQFLPIFPSKFATNPEYKTRVSPDGIKHVCCVRNHHKCVFSNWSIDFLNLNGIMSYAC